MAPKKSESSTAAGAGINAARKVAAHVPSPPEGDPSGPQPKVRAQAPSSRTRYFRFDAAADRLVQTDAFGRALGGGEGQPQQTPRMPRKALGPYSLGHKTWAGRVAVPKNYWFRGAKIKDTAERAITPVQVADLWAFIQHVLEEVEIVETFKKSALYDQRLTRENLEMHSVNKYFVKPLTEPHKCSFVDLVSAAEAQPPKWFVSHAWSTPFSQTVSMLNLHVESRGLPPTTPFWICTFANNQHDLGQPL